MCLGTTEVTVGGGKESSASELFFYTPELSDYTLSRTRRKGM